MGKVLRVAVVFGGRSAEHPVSVASARSVLANLDRSRFLPVPVGIGPDGGWLTPEATRRAVQSETSAFHWLPATGGPARGADPWALLASVDCVFPLVHGSTGEDGSLQGLLELCNVAYVGCGVVASATGIDKWLAKLAWKALGLPTVPAWRVPGEDFADDAEAALRAAEQAIPYPWFVKPARAGSSVGVSPARSREDAPAAVRQALTHGRYALVEPLVRGREIECAVLGGERPAASVVGEIRPSRGHEFYDYEAKYGEGGADLIVPADLPQGAAAKVQELAVAAFRAIDGADLARVDFFVTDKGPTLLNEINTLPGFTAASMYPRLWEATGVPYRELLTRLVTMAVQRHGR